MKVKNSRHAVHNELARFTKEYDIEDVMNSPVVSDPLGCSTFVRPRRRRRPRGLLGGVRQGPRPRRSRANRRSVHGHTRLSRHRDRPALHGHRLAGATPEPLRGFKQSIGDKVYEESVSALTTSMSPRSTTVVQPRARLVRATRLLRRGRGGEPPATVSPRSAAAFPSTRRWPWCVR